MTHDALVALVKQEAQKQGVPWEAVYAICMTESSGNEFAIKHESHYRWTFGSSLTLGETLGQKTSWGLMQIMGAVAREYGMTDQFSALWDPAINLNYGIQHLKRLKAKHGTWPHAISAYNAGTPIVIDGKYKNQGYVDKVLARWSFVEHQVPLKESEV